ncbi:MAG: hypothetical protein P1V20_04540 [Verrucomicrobiales bacterium]|nr:hypothetical protein [Verrucomicrobiales bacterium]
MRVWKPLSVAGLCAGLACAHLQAEPEDEHGEHSLGLDEEAVCYTEYGEGLTERIPTINDMIDNKVHPENIERAEKLKARPLDWTADPVPEYNSLFGGERFLSPGPIDPGTVLDTGATYRPSFFAWGSLRSALQTFNRGEAEGQVGEWANRLDLFGNYSFSTTERIVVGLRVLDKDGDFTGVRVSEHGRDEFVDGFDIEPQTFFFEGNIGEIFPSLEPEVMRRRDWGISLGRQPLNLQDGILVNDNLDAIGITRHNTFLAGASNARISAFLAFNEVHRNDRVRDNEAALFALSGCFDYFNQTIETDLVYVYGDDKTGGDGLYLGAGQLRQFGYWNSNLRVNASFALDAGSPAIDDGVLITNELSRVMPYNHDILSVNTFVGVNRYTSAARDPDTGGPLGGFGGLLYRTVGIGSYGAPLQSVNEDVYGAAVGYQHFLDKEEEKQIAVEVGGNRSWDDSAGTNSMVGAAIQYQQKINDSTVAGIGGFWANRDGTRQHGVRTELNRKF